MTQANFWEQIFPPKYDFYALISAQAAATADGLAALEYWLHHQSPENAEKIRLRHREADNVRFRMEADLIEAFATPFDRQDIYSLSIEMDRVLEYATDIVALMEAYEVSADDTMRQMVKALTTAFAQFSDALKLLASNPRETERRIADIRANQELVEAHYLRGAAALFKTGDTIQIMKLREIYRQIKDAAAYLGHTADILHKIVVRII